MEAKHTAVTNNKYPLKVEFWEESDRYVITTAQGNHFASTYDPEASRLIASAPELLSELKNLLMLVEDVDAESFGLSDYGLTKRLEDARKVLAKAEGRV